MKKNFLKVAALLIAAMLLVVSCSQEVAPKDENNGLVDAKLNIAFGRDLLVEGDSDAEDFYLDYTTEYQWTNGTSQEGGYTEDVKGVKTNEKLEPNGKLGWLTPGYWKITVNAYESNGNGGKKDNKVIFTGNTSAYFTSKTSTATIFLEPAKADNNSITFDFTMQNLGVYNTDYVVKYSISMNGTSLASNVPFTASEITDVKKADGTSDNQSKYNKRIDKIGDYKLASGYYTVTVSVYEVKDSVETLKGGITKGMLLAGNTATVKGHIEPSDYVGSTVKAYFVDVDTALTGSAGGYSNGKVTVTFTLTDSTNTTKYGADLTNIDRTYIWDFDLSDESVVVEGNTPLPENKQITKTFDYEKPGVKNASCTTIYSYTADNKGTEEKTDDLVYFWAETKSVQVEVPVTGFTY